MTSSLIISIYNSPEFLDRVLASIVRQIVMPTEVIVSEDGNFVANQGVVNQWQKKWPKNSKLLHLTQRDDGNRKPLAMNKALALSLGEYLVFIDGDCVLRRDFVAEHLRYASKDSFLTGRRVELSLKATEFLTLDRINRGYLDKIPWHLLYDSIFGETFTLSRFFKTPRIFRKLFGRDRVNGIRGCNFSVHKKNLVAINGFNNDFSGAYEEDTEVEWRLKYLGIKMKSVRGAAIQYHLWHPQQTRDPQNQTRLQALMAHQEPRTPNGLNEASKIS